MKPLLYFDGTISTVINATFPKGRKINETSFEYENIIKNE